MPGGSARWPSVVASAAAMCGVVMCVARSSAERQVSTDGMTYELPRPFLIIATQNPVDHEGTFPLPEAQLDRFLVRLSLGYPSEAEEMMILDRLLNRSDASLRRGWYLSAVIAVILGGAWVASLPSG